MDERDGPGIDLSKSEQGRGKVRGKDMQKDTKEEFEGEWVRVFEKDGITA